ncbi:hypothetical protein DPMN_111830 [Dreissena polymorpha]|uniref:Uncharacterized protein n=1 Tax=Dreissena polymorpha TaxID=45954 RepID=A0A9D4KFX8_DREPO|nr:hypothetical protein DPMN_111830 [Dreissena polymorpha]
MANPSECESEILNRSEYTSKEDLFDRARENMTAPSANTDIHTDEQRTSVGHK